MSKRAALAKASDTAPARQRRTQGVADAYLVAADAPATVRAYTADWRHFASWCKASQVSAMPVTPELVGEYLAELGEGYAKATLRRKVAAITRATRIAGMPLNTRHPSIRDVLRGIGRTHGSPARRAQALTTDEVQRLVDTCGDDLVGLRDRALLLTFAEALRRSELCAVEVEHLHWRPRSLELLIPRSKTDPEAEGDWIGIPTRPRPGNVPRSRAAGLAASRRHRGWTSVPRRDPA